MARAILRDGVYRTLRQRIVSGHIPPGANLGEASLAAELKVSRTPVREAIRQLYEEGFVEYTPHKGARVAEPTPEMVREVFDIREALEAIAAREAAPRTDPARLTALREHFEILRLRIARGDLSDVGDRIHAELFHACGNERLKRLMSVYRSQVTWFQHVAAQVPGRLLRAFREHESILSALESRDPDWAEGVTRAHVRNTLRDLLHSLEQATENAGKQNPK